MPLSLISLATSSQAVLRTYSCTYGGIQHGQPCTGDLDAFVKMVTEDLWKAIRAACPKPKRRPTPLEQMQCVRLPVRLCGLPSREPPPKKKLWGGFFLLQILSFLIP